MLSCGVELEIAGAAEHEQRQAGRRRGPARITLPISDQLAGLDTAGRAIPPAIRL